MRAEGKHREVRLRRVARAEDDRVLDVDERHVEQGLSGQAVQATHAGRTAGADRAHFDDLALDELDSGVFPQDAQLGQALVRLHGEGTSEDRRCHEHNMVSGSDQLQRLAHELRNGAATALGEGAEAGMDRAIGYPCGPYTRSSASRQRPSGATLTASSRPTFTNSSATSRRRSS